ncbi:MAG: hypothetical protein IKZ87_05140 [Actinomycetaceae bacterium]|nr:hypothetical protein [Actinomycetaceae bacterium]
MALLASPFVALRFEQEVSEAFFGGLVIGSVIGSVLGVAALVFNKNHRPVVTLLSMMPICVFLFFMFSLIPYLFYENFFDSALF